MSRKSVLPLVLLLSLFAAAAHALQFVPAGPIGQLGYAPVRLVAVSESAPQVVYAATGANLFRSTDAGATWTTLTVPSSTIDQLAVDPTNSAIVYFVGLRHTYRSDDSGVTWKDLSPQLGTISTLAIRIDPQTPSTLYIGARCEPFPSNFKGGVYKSTNRGETWSLLSQSVNCVDFLSLDPASPQRLFAGTRSGEQFRTDDAGRTWQRVSGELPVFDVIADPIDPARRYGLGRGPAGDVYLHFVVSADGGATWLQQPTEGLPPGGQRLAIDRTTRRLFLIGQSFGLYVSDDLGLHWRHIDAVTVRTASLSMAAAGDVLYVASVHGLDRLPMSDPDAPTTIHLGDPAPLQLTVYRMAFDPNDASTLYATALEGSGVLDAYRVYRSTDLGATWQRITDDSDTAWRQWIAVDAIGDLYAADKHTMWRFSKATQTWETWTAPDLVEPQMLLANPQRPGWLYAANTGWAGYSTDGGHTWTRIENLPSGFWSMSIAPNGSDLVGGSNEGAFVSNDGGVTWRALPTGRFETKAIAIAPSRPATIYRLTNPANGQLLSGLYRSDDGGETWTALHWPGEHDWAYPIAVDPRDDRSVWIGLAHSSDGGMTWTIEPSTTPVPILSVAFNRDGSALFGLARNYSIWRAVRGNRRRASGR